MLLGVERCAERLDALEPVATEDGDELAEGQLDAAFAPVARTDCGLPAGARGACATAPQEEKEPNDKPPPGMADTKTDGAAPAPPKLGRPATAEDIAKVDGELKLNGRIDRDGWVNQARGFVEAAAAA